MNNIILRPAYILIFSSETSLYSSEPPRWETAIVLTHFRRNYDAIQLHL